MLTGTGGPEVLQVRGAARPAGRPRRGADRGQGGGHQLRRHDGPRRPLPRRAEAPVRARLRGRRRGRVGGGGGRRATRSATGSSPAPASAARRELVTRPGRAGAAAARSASASSRAPPSRSTTAPPTRRWSLMGSVREGDPRPDPRRGGRRRHLGHPDRPQRRRRDLRHRLALQARGDPGAGSRPPDRLPQPRLRGGGDADHRRRGSRPGHRRARADLVPQGLPPAALRRAAGHVRALGELARGQARHPGDPEEPGRRCRRRRCPGGRA